MTPAERADARKAAIAEAVSAVRAIERDKGVTRESLGAIRATLLDLAAQRELFPLDDFPAPEKDGKRNNALYRLSEDADHRFALYAQRSEGDTNSPAHDHTTWAVIVGIDGEELNRFYRKDADEGVVEVDSAVVTTGTGVALMPEDLHSIHIAKGPVLNFHMYGLGLEQLHGRRYYKTLTNEWKYFPASDGIRDLPEPA
ncbi:MAG: cysteine dioxygenase [Pseudomonadota bacterium]|nr:cysteine dioxygenase [Pseudomonadota bacterium]